jgi:hypothetical protein
MEAVDKWVEVVEGLEVVIFGLGSCSEWVVDVSSGGPDGEGSSGGPVEGEVFAESAEGVWSL